MTTEQTLLMKTVRCGLKALGKSLSYLLKLLFARSKVNFHAHPIKNVYVTSRTHTTFIVFLPSNLEQALDQWHWWKTYSHPLLK